MGIQKNIFVIRIEAANLRTLKRKIASVRRLPATMSMPNRPIDLSSTAGRQNGFTASSKARDIAPVSPQDNQSGDETEGEHAWG